MSRTVGKHSKENNKKRKFPFFRLISVIIIVICAVYIWNWIKENQHSEEIMEVAREAITINNEENSENTEDTASNITVDFDKLRKTNPDVVGWIIVNNTNIDYPVVQTTDNSFYLSHSLDKEYNAAGWPFADYRVKGDGKDKNITIYGHNRKDGSMFGSLKNILQPEWYENETNLQVDYITEDGLKKYQVFSVYQIAKETYYTDNSFESNEEYMNFLKELQSRSKVDFGVELEKDDQILTLSTCADNNYYRVVLHAKLIK